MLSRYRRSEFLQGIVQISGGRLLAQIISIGALPFITRTYSPAEFGWYAIFIAYCSILSSIATFSLHSGIVRSKDALEAEELFTTAVQTSVALHVCLALITLISRNLQIEFDNILLLLILIGSLLTSILTALQALANYNKKYKNIAQQGICRAIIYTTLAIATPIILSRHGVSTGGEIIAIAYIIGTLFSSIFLIDRTTLPILSNWTLQIGWKTILRERDLIFFLFPATWIDMVSARAIIWTYSLNGADTMLGYFHLSERTLSLPSTLISSAVATVFTRHATDVIKRSKAELLYFVFKIWLSLAGIAILPLIFFLLFAPQAFRIVFGEEWAQAGEVARWLSVVYFFQFISTPTSSIFLVARRLNTSLLLSIITSVMRVVSVYFGWMWDGAIGAIIGFTIAEVLSITLYNVIGIVCLVEK